MKFQFLASVLLFSFLLPSYSSAHPHSWIEMKTEIVGSDGNVNGFKMEWTFDAMTSAYMLDGYDLSKEKKAESLQKVADLVINNMYAEHYFTFFYDDLTPIRYKTAVDAKLTKKKAKATLSFYLPLSKPQKAIGKSLKLLIFEPSYYVDMSWNKKSDIVLSKALQAVCSLTLDEPNPTAEQMNYALLLPTDSDPDNALGQLFTQTARLNCLNR